MKFSLLRKAAYQTSSLAPFKQLALLGLVCMVAACQASMGDFRDDNSACYQQGYPRFQDHYACYVNKATSRMPALSNPTHSLADIILMRPVATDLMNRVNRGAITDRQAIDAFGKAIDAKVDELNNTQPPSDNDPGPTIIDSLFNVYEERQMQKNGLGDELYKYQHTHPVGYKGTINLTPVDPIVPTTPSPLQQTH